MTKTENTRLIKAKAAELGFDRCGIAKAERLEAEAPRFEKWLKAGLNGEMAYLAASLNKRLDPREVVDGAKSVICLLHNYYTNQEPSDPAAPRIAKYAYGRDYHLVLKEKLDALLEYLREQLGAVNGSVFVDSGPILEKAWGARAGLGWIGKNSVLINHDLGSFCFLSELVVDLELEYDRPVRECCADCRLCLEACPTGAIVEPRVIDARKCLSYLTIEFKGELSTQLYRRVFGCDICQEVCPWNQTAVHHTEPLFDPHPALLTMTAAQWREMTRKTFDTMFRETAIARTGWERLKRNIAAVSLGMPPRGSREE
jgi:epoxyqueuosine reductase